jgi:hypothetical protein
MGCADIARSRPYGNALRRGKILQQFNAMTGRFEDRDQDFRAGHARDFTGQRASVMRAVGKLEAQNITPETKGALNVGNREPSVIHCGDLE